jgi:hypothetical protein
VGFDRGLGEQQRWKGEKQEKEKGAVSHRPGMSLYLWAKALKKDGCGFMYLVYSCCTTVL